MTQNYKIYQTALKKNLKKEIHELRSFCHEGKCKKVTCCPKLCKVDHKKWLDTTTAVTWQAADIIENVMLLERKKKTDSYNVDWLIYICTLNILIDIMNMHNENPVLHEIYHILRSSKRNLDNLHNIHKISLKNLNYPF
jgi:hypothetical protein